MLRKYPRTFHLPWSEGATDDDKVMVEVPFEGQRVIVTEKMDGENTSIYKNDLHARSIDGRHHPSRNWVKQFASSFQHELPSWLRICGENMYARHSIAYDELPSYFLGFSVWDEMVCWHWDKTLELFDKLGIVSVPVIYDGLYDEQLIKDLWTDMDNEHHEGYVVRLAAAFDDNQFSVSVGKFVRKNHVQTDDHWMNGPIVPNKLRAV